jgi:hypothetical protein
MKPIEIGLLIIQIKFELSDSHCSISDIRQRGLQLAGVIDEGKLFFCRHE